MFEPATTGSGVSTFVTDRSAEPAPTVVVAVPLPLAPFGSEVVDVAVAVLVMTVPFATPAPTATVSVKTALPVPMLGFEQETVPVPPTAGVVHDQPPGLDSDTKVVPAGSVSERLTVLALLGPALL